MYVGEQFTEVESVDSPTLYSTVHCWGGGGILAVTADGQYSGNITVL